ncbi:putative CWC16 protein [Seiridium cardinale]|uniref:CWC16 protein n=1 Tax=Seiridium cardinale TaxID=138064 RepID=A0ABR2XJ66_9PEZI
MQGFNMGRYVPPDLEGTISGNKLHKKHPLGSRASRPGALTVRFEMPFAVWCTTCPKETIIGQGVRFNASKTRVGSYYSTPIFAFQMKHTQCGGTIEIRTDPQNTAYVVTEGGRRRDDGEDKVKEGDWEILTDAERQKLRGNAFAKLEKTIEDREQMVVAKQRVEELQESNGRTWDNPYEMNRKLRKEFRAGRHQREKDETASESLKDRMSLGIDLVPEKAADRIRAGLIDFGSILREGKEYSAETRGLNRALFDEDITKAKTEAPNGKKRLKSEVRAEQVRGSLVSEIAESKRAAQDPFLNLGRSSSNIKTPVRLPGIKRKRSQVEIRETGEQIPPDGQEMVERSEDTKDRTSERATTEATTLVSYDSDSA